MLADARYLCSCEAAKGRFRLRCRGGCRHIGLHRIAALLHQSRVAIHNLSHMRLTV